MIRILTILLPFLTCSLRAQTLALVWKPSISTNVIGYKLYYGGQSGVYTNIVDVGNATNCVVSNIQTNVTHYFATTAYDDMGVESQFSTNELEWPRRIPQFAPWFNKQNP